VLHSPFQLQQGQQTGDKKQCAIQGKLLELALHQSELPEAYHSLDKTNYGVRKLLEKPLLRHQETISKIINDTCILSGKKGQTTSTEVTENPCLKSDIILEDPTNLL